MLFPFFRMYSLTFQRFLFQSCSLLYIPGDNQHWTRIDIAFKLLFLHSSFGVDTISFITSKQEFSCRIVFILNAQILKLAPLKGTIPYLLRIVTPGSLAVISTRFIYFVLYFFLALFRLRFCAHNLLICACGSLKIEISNCQACLLYYCLNIQADTVTLQLI